jgi:glycosyltransferase involved in cell wall biosynthesis
MTTTHEPSVTVVMPLYNKEAEVRRAVESVLSQTIQDFELVVVNDGSTDNSPEIVRSIDDPRIKIIDQENEGVSAARNRGIKESRADLIAFIDADDEWKSSFLETILNLKEKFPSCNVFATNYLYREGNGKYRLPIIRGIPHHPWEGIIDDYFGVAVKSDPPLFSSAVAVIKEAILSVGLFPVGVNPGEDLLTWARLAIHCNIAYSTKPEAIYWLRVPMVGIPSHVPENNDVVGQSLEELRQDLSSYQLETFNKYIALWHRMRTAQYLQAGFRSEAIRELCKIARFSKLTPRLYLYFAIALFPAVISSWLFMGLGFLKTIRRRLY